MHQLYFRYNRFSKGVMLTGNNFAGNITFGIRTKLLAPWDFKLVAFLPLAHAYGCAFDFLTATVPGVMSILSVALHQPKILLNAFAEVRPNVIFCVPLIIEKYIKSKFNPCSKDHRCVGYSVSRFWIRPSWHR